MNIASLNAHIDDLRSVLSRLKPQIDIIGISEHKIKKGCTPSNNIDIGGYDEFKFEPTGSSHGGAGFYIKTGYDYIPREDLNLNSTSHFEAMFVELILKDRKNIIVSCLYRHPSSDIFVTDLAKNIWSLSCLKFKERRKSVC